MFQSINEVFDQLNKKNGQIDLGLDRMEWMLEKLGHPERRLKFIHIAGTNGKGSTAAMISTVLQESGYDTGLFTSPYLTSPNEQIQLNGTPISDDSLLRWINHFWPYVCEMKEEGLSPLSYYEIWALSAICYFAHESTPGFVVWETGLGGRLDATNVVHPIISVVTQIGLDHRDWLGDTIEEITEEKAAIIKAGVPVICSATHPKALAVIEEKASMAKSSLYLLDRDFQCILQDYSSHEQRFTFSNIFRTVSDLSISLIGRHQLDNAATALMTLEVLRQYYATRIELHHLQSGLLRTVWPGRLEKVSDDPLILLDGAHNVDSTKALVQAVNEYYTYGRLILLTAMMKDKEIDRILGRLLPYVDEVITTEVTKESRSLSAELLAVRVKQQNPVLPVQAFSSVEEGLKFAKNRQQAGDLLLIAGSLYLISEVRSLLN